MISVTAPLTNSGTASAAVLGITVGTGMVLEDDSLRPDLPYIKTQLATVATSGAYADLSGKPTTLAGYGITDGQKKITVSSSAPTGGVSGDIHLRYSP